MSRLDGKCDNCGADVSPEEGDWWITGHYLCPKCYKKWKERYDKVIKSELDDREKMWEEYSKSDEEKIEDTIEAEIEAKKTSKKEEEKEKESKKKEIESKKKKHKDLFDFK